MEASVSGSARGWRTPEVYGHIRCRRSAGRRGEPRRPGSAHVGVAVVGGRGEQLLDGAGADPADQVEERARLVVGAAGPGAAQPLLAGGRGGGLVVDVEVARRVPEPLSGVGDGGAILGQD